ncbi:uncharacterized protein LOC125008533 [Mugil cephalus]|uniref:uncharacterized protein LOC125008533 n=1 Tax=Mugil cephalus TaxID=48193 RepID=UPI001FB630EB|nr:uncharacterized protein LOC125008533 [Mugil cephalus]
MNSKITISDFFNVHFTDHNQQLSVYVKQTPETASVQLGASVTLQCSLLSRSNESGVQCPGEHRVHWFRTGSGGFHPSVIYTHSNTTDEGVGRSCVYHLSKTIQNFSDAGTYYCALVTCGQILFGEGTKVESGPQSDPVVFVLGGLLVCCVAVIVGLICCTNRSQHCQGETNTSHHLGHDRSTADNDLDGEAKVVNYAALDFSTTRMKQGNTNMKRQEFTECMYSSVRADH